MQYSETLADTGKDGLLKEMIKKAKETGKDAFTVNELTESGTKRNWNQTKKYVEELSDEGKVWKVTKQSEQEMYKPDPLNPNLPEQVFLGPILHLKDLIHVATNAADNLVYECSNCGRLQRYLPINLLLPLGHALPVMCKYCDKWAAYLTYTPQFTSE